MDWTAGYRSDVEYPLGFYPELSPTYMNMMCILKGVEPVDISRPFTYCELGCGRGLTAQIMAAGNPQGKFYAVDFMPAHVAGARELVVQAELANLTFLENSFADLAAGEVADVPLFDFITLHGVYTWVSAECRGSIVDFIARYLKPGGIAYVSYNAMPGMSAILPLQRMLVEHMGLFGGDGNVGMKEAAGFVEKMRTAQANYFTANEACRSRFDGLERYDPEWVAYLVHEYGNLHWQPLYHADVARDLSSAKLEFVGNTPLLTCYPALYLTADQQQLLAVIKNQSLRETFKDYFLNTSFRSDIFVRGARRMPSTRQNEWLQRIGLALVTPRDEARLKAKLPSGEIVSREELSGPILDALARRPHSFAELSALPEMASCAMSDLSQTVALLTETGQVAPYFISSAEADAVPAHKMNRVFAGLTRHSDRYQMLASPLLGNGVRTTFLERLVYVALSAEGRAPGVSAMARRIWREMQTHGIRLHRDGKPLESDEDNLAELRKRIKNILTVQVPIWRQLKIL